MKIVVLDGFTLNPGDLSWEPLKALGETVLYDRTFPRDVLDRSKEATALLTNKTVLDQATIQACPQLQYIGVLATGTNVVDAAAASNRGIVVTNVPGYSTHSVAQQALSLLLELTNRVGDHSRAVADGEWSSCEDFTFRKTRFMELAGKTMGIVGLGAIGGALAQMATGLGMDVIAYSPYGASVDSVPLLELDEVLQTSDVLSLHCPLTDENQGLINKERLSLMKPTALLINTSRGPLIDDRALADALNAGTIGGAGLDVLSTEPPQPDNPLFAAKNCVITPHVAWSTVEARQRLMTIATDNVKAFLNGKPENQINR